MEHLSPIVNGAPHGRRVLVIVAGLLILALALAGCGSSSGSPADASKAGASTVVPTEVPAPTAAPTLDTGSGGESVMAPAIQRTPYALSNRTGAAVITVFKHDKLGQFLVDDQGACLYLYTKDSKNTSTCSGDCEANWPPLITSGAPKAGDGITASLLGTIQRADGKTQVTYNGWPLYYYAKDTAAADPTGQKAGGVWFVVSPKGEKIE